MKGWEGKALPNNTNMFSLDMPIVIWFIEKKRDYYLLLDSCGQVVMRRDEKRKHEIYKYCEENGIDLQEEF
jgi:hypothetical protein